MCIEIIDSKDQLTISKPSIKYLSKDLSAEIKGFKFHMTLKVM